MQLSDIENAVRLDLFDPTGANQRWGNSDIDRAIDKAVTRYSDYYPNIAYSDMASQPYQRTYPYPTSWNPAYPVWWIERIIYPLQIFGSQYAPPGFGAIVTAQSGSGLSIGTYQYAVTLLTQGGETPASPLSSVTTSSGNTRVSLTNIPVGPVQANISGIATNTVLGRNLYRTLVGGNALFLLTTIVDNTTISYLDSVPDSALSGMPSPPTLNTSGVMYWPPLERSFSEYSNLFDSSAALAAGGNLGAMGAVGSGAGPTGTQEPTFTLMLNNVDLPKDNTLILRIFYATRHQLDSSGSTIPDIHRDVIVLGACAYAMEAYQTPTNDGFAWGDGSLRDHVDDSMIPTSWRNSAKNKMDQFIQRLTEIRQARDYATSARVHWGDVPRFWTRL
jgi:hypothetical protein